MHIVVCIKQVPDSAQIRVHPVTNTIMRQGVPTIINPYDLFSLEEAMRLRDKLGGEVTVLSMGPPSASDSLRKALTYGADRAVLLTDRFFAGSDTLATSYALASAISKVGETFGAEYLVFAGQVVLAYGKLVLDKRFILPALSMSLLMSGLFASFGAAPIILMEGFSLSAVQAGLYFAATVFVVFAAGMAAPRLAHHYGPANITVLGIACAMIGGILLFAGPANPSMWSYVRVRPVKSS